MNRLQKLFGTLVFLTSILSLVAFAGETLKSVSSNVTVTPKFVSSFKDLAEKTKHITQTPGNLENHAELSNMTEEEMEALKEGPMPEFDGHGILTIDKSANRGVSGKGIKDVMSTLAPSLSTNFEGNIQGGGRPGDLMMAVGPNHVVSVANSTIRIRTKAGVVVQTINAGNFFGPIFVAGLGFYDPKVLYDVVSDRFVILFDFESDSPQLGAYYIAVSQTSDPTAGWYIYNFDMGLDGSTPTTNWPDFPGLGVDNTSIYMTGNMYTFPQSTAAFQYVKTRVVSKLLMYQGSPVTFADIIGTPGTGVFTLKPAISLSPTNVEYLFHNPNGGGGSVNLFRIIDAPFAPTMENIGPISVSSYGIVPKAVQQGCTGTNSTVETGDNRTTDPVWRDGYLYATHHVGINLGGSVAAIRYYKINTSTSTLATEETYGAPGTFYYYPAVTVDAGGTVFISYSRSSATEFATAVYSGRRRFDTNIQPSAVLKAGGVSYWCGSSSPRWGDYTGIAIDPSDSGGLQSSAWVDGNWAKGPSTWGSWIGKVTFLFHSISGKVYNDCDSSAGTTIDRLPVALATVSLFVGDSLIKSTTSDSAGNYSFDRLDDGSYNVRLTLPPTSSALAATAGTGGDSEQVGSPTKIAVYLSGAATASEICINNNFAVVLPKVVPVLTNISPSIYPAGEPGFILAVNGSNFAPCSVVRIDGSDRVTTFNSATQLHAAILVSDVATIGNHLITVFTSTPGGGISNAETLFVVAPFPVFSSSTPGPIQFLTHYVGSSTPFTFSVTNDGSAPLSISSAASDNSQFTVSPPNATIARQTTQDFTITFAPIIIGVDTGHITFTHNAFGSPTTITAFGKAIDSTMLRTASAEDWATALDVKNKHKGSLHKPDKVFFKFNLITPPGGTSAKLLSMDFSMDVVGVIHSTKLATDTVGSFAGKKVIVGISPDLPGGQEIEIEGVGNKGKAITVKCAWGTDAKVAVTTFKRNEPGLPRPNLNNVGEELFPKGFGQPIPYFSDNTPLMIGVPLGTKGASSVKITKYANVIISMIDVRSSTMHSLGPKCLNRFDNNDSIKSQIKTLSPLKQNNKLFAELLAFKLNIAASASNNKFPPGLGEVTFEDTADEGNPFNELMLKDIAHRIDTLISCFPSSSVSPPATLDDAYDVLERVNAEFRDGGNFKDTISFLAKTRLTGVKRLGDVPYLRKTPGVPPVSILSHDLLNGGMPLAYALYQNYPNPFNPTTTIQFDLPEQATVTLKIYNILGQEMGILADHQVMDEGMQEMEFDASALPSGVYFYRIIAEGLGDIEEGSVGHKFMDVKKMMLVK